MILTNPHSESVFVFGSNLAGRHGAGAALVAKRDFGARIGVGVGLVGSSYAIPTKDSRLQVLSFEEIAAHVSDFLEFARAHPDKKFRVTRVGCGLAGYRDEEIFPLFKQAPENCMLPGIWEAKRTGVARIIIAGTRSFADYDRLFYSTEEAIKDWGIKRPVIVSGGAKGADSLGERFAIEAGYDLVRFPAQWNRLGRRAGPERNLDMAWYSTHALVFWDGASPGSKHMLDCAKENRLRRRLESYDAQKLLQLGDGPAQGVGF